MLAVIEIAGRYAAFAGRMFVAALAACRKPSETSRQLYVHFVGALPLTGIAGLAIGIVLWMHLRGILVRFAGPEAVPYLPTALSLAVVLEFAPIGAGLIVAGRSGASLAAELGSMKLTEQLDAFEMAGRSPARDFDRYRKPMGFFCDRFIWVAP
jgi:phospholipid/cholesterol/gamma-HCH transport system permease protein